MKALMVSLISALLFLVQLLPSKATDYKKWKLVKLNANSVNSEQTEIMESIEGIDGARFIDASKVSGSFWVGVESKKAFEELELMATKFGLKSEVLHHDIRKLIESTSMKEGRQKRSIKADHFDTYMTYDQMEKYFSLLESAFPSTLQRRIVGTSYEGRNISLFIISTPFSSTTPISCSKRVSVGEQKERHPSRIVGSSNQRTFGRFRNHFRSQQHINQRPPLQTRVFSGRSHNSDQKRKRKLPFRRRPRRRLGQRNRDRIRRQVGYFFRQPAPAPIALRSSNGNERLPRHPIIRFPGANVTHNSITITKDVINDLKTRQPRPIIFIDGGTHSREWISPAAALYLMHELLTNHSSANGVDWFVIPMVNPDGYVYSWDKDRFWRKTRSPSEKSGCFGADINRNFNHRWGEIDTSGNACSEHYGGKSAHSEVETRIIERVIKKEKHRVKAYVSLHNWGQEILHPYCSDMTSLPRNKEKLEKIGEGMAESIRKAGGESYKSGRAAALLYPASGTSMDWSYDTMGIPFSFLMELRDRIGLLGFLLPDRYIKSTGNDVVAAMEYLSLAVQDKICL